MFANRFGVPIVTITLRFRTYRSVSGLHFSDHRQSTSNSENEHQASRMRAESKFWISGLHGCNCPGQAAVKQVAHNLI